MTDPIDQLSQALAARIATAAPNVVAIRTGRGHVSGILWRPDVVVTSEQVLPDERAFAVQRAGRQVSGTLAGRDSATNVAAIRLAESLDGTLPAAAPQPRVGELAVLVGADAGGHPTGRLAMLHQVGPAWHSQRAGRIDLLLRLDARLGRDEGGPVLAGGGLLLGLSTAGPRGRSLIIPTATVERVLDPLLAEGRVPRGWFGVVMQPVSLPEALRATSGQDSGMMVTKLAAGGPAEQAGGLPGDVVLDIDGVTARPSRQLATLIGDRIGQPIPLRILRGGTVQTLSVTVGPRPPG